MLGKQDRGYTTGTLVQICIICNRVNKNGLNSDLSSPPVPHLTNNEFYFY